LPGRAFTMKPAAEVIMQTIEKYRPRIHFSPENSWTNDPNGMVYIDGTYHLFYQNNPDADTWGPMYWGHAVTKDLLHWEHLPVAIEPDDLGSIFSGSCVLDRHNVSGLGTGENPPLIAIYTSHNFEKGIEAQSLSYSTDYVHFHKYAGNPIISNPDIPNFRDPKIFRNPDGHSFSLAVSAHDRINFYKSENLLDWEKTGEFLTGEHGLDGIAECPDCFPVHSAQGDKWILIVSMIINPEDRQNTRHQTQYFIGEFDGSTFIDTEKADEPLLLDYGMDYYAAVSFMDAPGSDPLLLAWADNWTYANQTPSRRYRGQMSVATKAVLVSTAKGSRLSLIPVGIDALAAQAKTVKQHEKHDLHSFGLLIHGSGSNEIRITNEFHEEFVLSMDDNKIRADRTAAGQSDFEEHFSLPVNSIAEVERYTAGDYDILLLFDASMFEIFTENGLISITMSAYPEHPYTDICVNGNAEMKIFELC
jgi:fructan beta-fructosidase